MPSIRNRAVRIGGCEGGITDHHGVLARMAKNEEVDIIFGDWMSEYNMTTRGMEKVQDSKSPGYETVFLESLEPALEHLAAKKIKLAANAGASGTELLAEHVKNIIAQKRLDLKVAWVSGDEISVEEIKGLQQKGERFQRLTTDKDLSTWEFDPLYAQCYLGGKGIAKAWAEGADIVLTGRVADPAPVIAAGLWWHGWTEADFDELAGALVCGHLIECGAYVCGANWSGFKSLGTGKQIINLGYPIAELASDGTCIVTKEKGSNGLVTTETCKSQVLYEIQGPWYFNSVSRCCRPEGGDRSLSLAHRFIGRCRRSYQHQDGASGQRSRPRIRSQRTSSSTDDQNRYDRSRWLASRDSFLRRRT